MKAIMNDIHDIVRMASDFCEATEENYPFDPKYFSTSVAELIADDSGCVLVGKSVNRNVAFLMGSIDQSLAIDKLQASEILWYCTPESRGIGASTRLPKEFEEWAIGKGAGLISMGAHRKSLGKIYRRRGYVPVSEQWLKEL